MPYSIFHAFGIVFLTLSWLGYDHYRPWTSFHSEALALLGIGLLLASTCLNRDTRATFAPRLCGWVMVVAAVPWLQYVLGISLFAGDALLASLYLCSLAAAIGLGYGYAVKEAENETSLTPVFYLLWCAALVSAAIGLLQWLNLQEVLAMYVVQTDAGDRAMGNLGQPNQLATLLLMGMVTLAWTYERYRIGAWGLVAGITFMTLVLVLTQSRAGMLSTVVVALFLMWKSRVAGSRIAPKYVLAWLLAYGFALSCLPALHDLLLMSGGRSLNPGVDSARITIWKQMISGIAQAPWLGYGWNETPSAHAAGSLAVPGSLTYTHAHNIVLDMLAWNGIPLGLLLVTACAGWLVSRMRGATRSSSVYAMACLLPVGLHSLVEYPFAYAYFLVAAGLMVGIVEASHPQGLSIRLNLRWVGGAVAVWFAIGGYIVHEYLLIEEDFRVVRFENLRIGQTPAHYQVPDVWMLSHLATMLKASRLRPLPDMNAEDVENLRKASLRFPYGVLGLRYALALGLNGNPVAATRQMAMIRGMYGEGYYQAAVIQVREMQREKYPQLSQVLTP